MKSLESMTRLEPFRVILVATSHPGNIGAVARAMWTMGLSRLWLVAPRRFPCAEATARAAGADEVLYRATVVDTLDQAIEGCQWVVGTSARARHLRWPELSPRQFAERSLSRLAHSPGAEMALVLGRESSGLTNLELERCQAVVRIASNPDYSSLNVGAATQILAYELYQAVVDAPSASTVGTEPDREHYLPGRPADDPQVEALASVQELEGLYGHFERALETIGYYDPSAPKLLMRRLRRLFSRAQLERSEVKILRGILAASERDRA